MISCKESHVCGHWACRQSWVGKKLCCLSRFSYFFRSSDLNAADVCFLYLYGLLYEQSLVTNIASIREYRRQRRKSAPASILLDSTPSKWILVWDSLLRFTFLDDFFRQQLRMRRTTFQMLMNVIAPRITRLDTRFRLGTVFRPKRFSR